MKKNYFLVYCLLFIIGYSYGQTNVDSSKTIQKNTVLKAQEIKGFSIYPNPVNDGILRINTFENAEKNIQIFDLTGKQVLFRQAVKSRHISVSNLDSGVYILKVSERGKIATRKLVIK